MKQKIKQICCCFWLYWSSFVLNATSGGVSIISFTSIVGSPVGIARASLTLFFSLTTGIAKKITKYNKKQKEKAWWNYYVS